MNQAVSQKLQEKLKMNLIKNMNATGTALLLRREATA